MGKKKKTEYNIDNFKDDARLVLKIAFPVSLIYFMYTMGFNFALGFIYGMTLLSYIFLFPPLAMIPYLDKVFNYSKSQSVVMKNESERNKSSKDYNKFKVKYNKAN